MANQQLAWSLPEMMRRAEEHVAAGRHAEALAQCERIIEIEPNNPEILSAIGILAVHFGEPARGAELLSRAVKLRRNVARYHDQLGAALTALDRLEEARIALERALKLKPRSVDSLCNLACVLIKQKDFAGAAPLLQRAIEIDPSSALAHYNLGVVFQRQSRINDATASYARAVACNPALAECYGGLVGCLNLLPDASLALIKETTCRWAALVKRPARPGGWSVTRDPHRRLRIGYVSGDFRRHSVAYFFEAALQAHDRAAFEITCYSNNPADDDLTERLQSSADRWRAINKMNDAAVAALIRSDGIDILIDLSGLTDWHRLPVFAIKPAPVQCTWLGYYGTTGLAEIDYIIADRFTLRPQDEVYFTEKPWRLPDSYLCFTPPDLDVSCNEPPASCGVVTFGSCNNVAKLNTAVVTLWCRLLDAVPASRLVLRSQALSSPEIRAALSQQFRARGIAGNRVLLMPEAGRQEVLTTYKIIDIALDPFPYGGGTTTAEALWMGVPVISLRGNRFTGRVSESILTTIGHPELVADNEAAYLDAAVTLAADLPRLTALRARLRQQLLASPLCDAARFARNLEHAYRDMWRHWCAAEESAA